MVVMAMDKIRLVQVFRKIPTPIGVLDALAQACWGDAGLQAGLVSLKASSESAPAIGPASAGIGPSSEVDENLIKACEGLLDQTSEQLREYFGRMRRGFELPIAPHGTVFQLQVWRSLSQIGYGEVWSYSRLAEAVGVPGGSRAVGAALGKNPLWIVVPCHRVVGKSGKLVGFAGGLDSKRLLIELEKNRHSG